MARAQKENRNDFRSGLVAILGRPNVGKSTLLNRLVGQPVAIVTPVAQTTRRRIRGVIHRPGAQLVLIDTPGVFLQRKQQAALLGQMRAEALAALHEADLALLLVEAGGRGCGADDEEDRLVLELLRRSGKKAFLAINKIDLLSDGRTLGAVVDFYRGLGMFEEILPISALKRRGLGRLLSALEKRLPPGPPFFPPDMFTDESERSLCAELIRQQIILQTEDEIPFRVAVGIESFREGADKQPTVIQALVYVERDSQKGIVIGRGGALIKAIGSAARRQMEKLLGGKVYLELKVKTAPDWSHTRSGLRRTGQLL